MVRLIALLMLTLLRLQSISQTPLIDTTKTCLPNIQLREMMRLNEVRKVQTKDLALKTEQIDLLEKKVAVKDSTITVFEQRVNITNKLTAAFDSSVANLSGQIGVQEIQKEQLKKDLKIANRKRVMNKILYGGLAAVALVLLAVK